MSRKNTTNSSAMVPSTQKEALQKDIDEMVAGKLAQDPNATALPETEVNLLSQFYSITFEDLKPLIQRRFALVVDGAFADKYDQEIQIGQAEQEAKKLAREVLNYEELTDQLNELVEEINGKEVNQRKMRLKQATNMIKEREDRVKKGKALIQALSESKND